MCTRAKVSCFSVDVSMLNIMLLLLPSLHTGDPNVQSSPTDLCQVRTAWVES